MRLVAPKLYENAEFSMAIHAEVAFGETHFRTRITFPDRTRFVLTACTNFLQKRTMSSVHP